MAVGWSSKKDKNSSIYIRISMRQPGKVLFSAGPSAWWPAVRDTLWPLASHIHWREDL